MSSEARHAILRSIRAHLAASVPFDKQELTAQGEKFAPPPAPVVEGSLIDLFKQSVEAVDGHCLLARGEAEIASALTRIISDVQKTKLRGQRIAISDVPLIERVMYLTDLDIEALTVVPDASEIFGFDVGITTAQAAIAETGTLVLESAAERHRLVSLVPPVHIAIIAASRIAASLGEALALLREGKDLSPAVTFITGPSRTADIELTLTIGVHGPQELYVIVVAES
jgi:L-lactate dehydrogenase complex protein LldG